MIPLQFCKSSHLLFGLYDPPADQSNSRGVVVCNPAGEEYYRGHSAVRHLAKSLQLAGIHALRFDYYGCGDSDGAPSDASLEGWTQDAAAAVEELKGLAGLSRVTLVGARLGAVVASCVAQDRPDIEKVVLWDPVADTREHLQDMIRRSRAEDIFIPPGWPEKSSDAIVDIDGFPVTAAMTRGLLEAAINVEEWRSVRRALLVADSRPLNTHAQIIAQAEACEVPLEIADLDGPDIWAAEGDFGSAGIPVEAINAIVSWLR